ncbi:hypothetical protein KIW84_031010 [Lathyrus oleraceus]|uniref:Aminotransferase-like plant mobile domain-containing protein n=1 Tax=Pisum sativum TaxID=3888 RepID=A0A9D5B098_PEA|nr:hypothetical protein KIW84_031010 [Pisum sativum]
MTSSKNGDETEVRMRHSCIPVNLSSINEKLTKTQRAHIECTSFKWAMDISNNFSISGGLLWELVSRWDVRSRGVRVRDRIVPFTPVDVSFALGLSIVVVLKEGKNKAQRHLNGCAAILQIWAFNHLSLGKAPAVSRFSFPRVLNWPIIDRVVATEEELKYDIVNAALFEQGQQFVDVIDYHKLVDENKDFKERIAVLEYEVRMMKEARVNTPFEEEVVQDDRQLVNFITEDEVGTLAGDVGHNTSFNDDANVAENQSKSKSNMATRMRKKPRKHGKRTRLNL